MIISVIPHGEINFFNQKYKRIQIHLHFLRIVIKYKLNGGYFYTS